MTRVVRTGIISAIAIINLLASIAVQLLLLSRFGLSGEMDAFFAASTIPQVVLAVLIGSAVNVVAPYFSGRPFDRDFSEDAWSVLHVTFGAFLVVSGVVAVFVAMATRLLLPGLAGPDLELATRFGLIASLSLPFSALSQVATAIHQGRGRFVWTGVVGAVSSVALLAAVFLAIPEGDLYLAAWLFAIRAGVQAFVLLSGLGSPWVHIRTATIELIIRGMKPLILSTSFFKTAPIIDRFLASFGAEGAISILQLFQQVFAAGASLFGKAIVEPLVVDLAADEKRSDDRGHSLKRYIRIHRISSVAVTGIFVLGGLILWIWGNELLSNDTLSRALPFWLAFAGLFTAGFLGQLSAAWYYAHGDTRSPARIGALGFSIGFALRLVLFPVIGVVAIAAATSVTQVYNWLMLHRPILRGGNQK